MDFWYHTRGNSSPNGKSRVWLVCPPSEKFFDEIENDIFRTQNCTVFYTEEAVMPDPEYTGQMQLIVIAVTKKIMSEYTSFITELLAYAQGKNIPVLPVLAEHGIEHLFQKTFGDIQYLDRVTIDSTAIPYEQKLSAFLERVLVSDEQIEKIKKSFDAYIFLSYRKKDRAYAQELMRLIHKNDFCEKTAVWYDEFLDIGEDFNDSIMEALDKSDLFTLVVTPNLVNEKNYIMEIEYPMAVREGKNILPVEMAETSDELLNDMYPGIPASVNGFSADELRDELCRYLDSAGRSEHSEPVHDYYVGLAYLSGIDVEVDYERAVKLISSAAQAGVEPAMKSLSQMYLYGHGVPKDQKEAFAWQQKLCDKLSSIDEDICTEEDVMRYLTEYMELGEMTYEAECYEIANDVYSESYEIAGKLLYGVLGKNIFHKAKAWFGKFILNRSEHYEEYLNARGASCFRMLEIALRIADGAGIKKWAEKTIKYINVLRRLWSNHTIAVHMMSVSYNMAEYSIENGNPEGTREWLENSTGIWKEINDDEEPVSPELRYLYTLVKGAYSRYYFSSGDIDAAIDNIKEKQQLLSALYEEFPERVQFVYEFLDSVIFESRILIGIGKISDAEQRMSFVEKNLEQEYREAENGEINNELQFLMSKFDFCSGKLKKCIGKIDEAVEVFKKGYTSLGGIDETMLDARYQNGLLDFCSEIGDIFLSCSNYKEAYEWYQKAYEIITGLLPFSKSFYHVSITVEICEKLMNIAIELHDGEAVEKWYEKARSMSEVLAMGFVQGKIIHKKIRKPENTAAYEKLVSREREIRRYAVKYRNTKDTLLSSFKPSEVSIEMIEKEMIPIIDQYRQAYFINNRDEDFDYHIMRVRDYLWLKHNQNKDKEETPPFRSLYKIQKRLLKNYETHLKYNESAVIVLTFCGYYYIIKCCGDEFSIKKERPGFMRFFDDIIFWNYNVRDIQYQEVWNHLYNLIKGSS